MKREYEWLIVEGCPRSGTGLLRDFLNTHKQIALSHELDLTKQNPKLLLRLYKAFFYGNKNLDEIKYFGDKHPEFYFKDYNKLKAKLNKIKVIHISRNPINVINSMMIRTMKAKKGLDETWNPNITINDACNSWIFAWNYINNNISKNYMKHIKYEDLKEKKELIAKELSEFLDISMDFDYNVIKDNKTELILSQEEIDFIKKKVGIIIKMWDSDLKNISSKIPKIYLDPFFKIKWKILHLAYRKLKNENSNFS